MMRFWTNFAKREPEKSTNNTNGILKIIMS